jgi:hypothetical protein
MYFRKILNTVRKLFIVLMVVLVLGFLIPQKIIMPVEGATKKSYSQNSFWAYPWGKSVTHKGVDIFARRELIFILQHQESFYIKEQSPEAVMLYSYLGQNGEYITMLILIK